jgi:hypothetical protein
LKAYAGSAPVTRASGRSLSVTHRRIKTTDSLPLVGFGPSLQQQTPSQPAITIGTGETTATGTPQRPGTYSTN